MSVEKALSELSIELGKSVASQQQTALEMRELTGTNREVAEQMKLQNMTAEKLLSAFSQRPCMLPNEGKPEPIKKKSLWEWIADRYFYMIVAALLAGIGVGNLFVWSGQKITNLGVAAGGTLPTEGVVE